MTEAPVTFSLEELWFMRSLVRHAMPGVEQWSNVPPASLELNTKICEAILVCEESIEAAKTQTIIPIREYTLPLGKADTLILDYVVPQDAKNSAGTLIGKNILLKAMVARHVLDGGWRAVAEEPVVTDMQERLEEWAQLQALKRQPRNRTP